MSCTGSSQRDQGRLLPALAVALQHPDISTPPHIVCTLLQVCKPWSALVTQTVAGTVAATLSVEFSAAGFVKLANFTAWLSKYPRFLRSIALFSTDKSQQDVRHYIRCAQDMLRGILQQVSEQKQLQLQSYSSNFVGNAGLLSLLPATLTSLELKYGVSARKFATDIVSEDSSALAHVLQRHCNLQTLSVQTWGESNTGISLPPSIGQAMGSLCQLTKLELVGVKAATQLQQLLQFPTQLQQLTLGITHGSEAATLIPLNLDHLCTLQSLKLSVEPAAPLEAVMPKQLIGLTAILPGTSSVAALEVTALKQLQQLVIDHSYDSPDQLLSLTALEQLRQLSLQYDNAAIAQAAAPIWQQLPYLDSLELILQVQHDAYGGIMNAVSELANLTKLTLQIIVLNPDEDNCYPFLKYVAKLYRLRRLKVSCRAKGPYDSFEMIEQEGLVLTGLQDLTHLSLELGSPVIDDSVACALIVHLTNLEYLILGAKCGKIANCVMPAVGKLTKLRHLVMPAFQSRIQARDALQFLTGLKALTHLSGFAHASDEALADFWLAVRGKRGYFNPYQY